MTQLSARFAAPLCLLLALAAVPVAVHSIGRGRRDDCRDPGALRDAGAIPGTSAVQEVHPPGRAVASTLQWTRAAAQTREPEISALDVRIVRSTDPKSLYLKPTGPLRRPSEFDSGSPRLHWIETEGERLPVRLIRVEVSGRVRIVAYLFAIGSRPVASPLRDQLATALTQVFTRARPLTLFAASGYAPRSREEALRGAALGWIVDAWRRYDAVCSG